MTHVQFGCGHDPFAFDSVPLNSYRHTHHMINQAAERTNSSGGRRRKINTPRVFARHASACLEASETRKRGLCLPRSALDKMCRNRRFRLVGFALLTLFGLTSSLRAAESSEPSALPFPGEKSSWHGFDRYDFVMDSSDLSVRPFKRPAGENSGVGSPANGERRCIVVAPQQAAPGKPWSWRGCYWDHQPQTEIELLRRGFHVAYSSADATLKPGKEWVAWHAYLTEKHGLSKKPAFIGMSRGGEYAYTWATTNPDNVSCIYADKPAD